VTHYVDWRKIYLEQGVSAARKSFGKFKPLLKFPKQHVAGWTTHVCGSAPNAGRTRERGAVFDTREDAIAYAVRDLELMVEQNDKMIAVRRG